MFNNSLFTVTAFTVRNKLRSKAFVVTSLIIAILLSVVINLPYIISLFQSNKPVAIGVIENPSGIAEQLERFYDGQEESGIRIVRYQEQGSRDANEAFLKNKVAGNEIKGFLEFTEDKAAGFPKVVYKSESVMNAGMTGKLQAALQSVKTDLVAQDFLTKEQLAKIVAPVNLGHVQISTTGSGAGTVGQGKTESQIQVATGMVYALIILLFMGVMITGQLIATEITAEKSSRVMEILVTSVAPLTQMFGKILGMFIVGISQIALLAAVAVINIMLPHNVKAVQDMHLSLGDIPPSLLGYAAIFYLLGFFLYSTLFAAVGSIVSRTEDLGQAIMPISFLSMAGFYIAIFGLTSPNAPFIAAMSFVPFFTPFIMFLRIGLSDPALWQVWLSIGALVLTILLMGWLSAKIYRTGVLMYGKRPSFKELRKAMKAYKV